MHGTDAVTVVPPPPFAVHVVPALTLEAADRPTVEDFDGNGLVDTAPLLALVSGSTLVQRARPVGRVTLSHAASTQTVSASST